MLIKTTTENTSIHFDRFLKSTLARTKNYKNLWLMLKAVAVQCSRLIIKHRNNAAVWVWVWVGLRPIDLIISKGCSMAPISIRVSTIGITSGRVIPLENLLYSCEYSAGTGLTRLVCQRCNCYCQFKEMHSECSIFSYNRRVYIITV